MVKVSIYTRFTFLIKKCYSICLFVCLGGQKRKKTNGEIYQKKLDLELYEYQKKIANSVETYAEMGV